MLKSTYMIRWLLRGTYANAGPAIAQRCARTILHTEFGRPKFRFVGERNFTRSYQFPGPIEIYR